MQAAADPRMPGARVASRAEAEALVDGTLATLAALEAVLAEETALIRVGKVAEALAGEERKGALAAGYFRALEAVKANAVALARFAPGASERLRAAHGAFGRTLEANRMVIATARAVAEGLIKTVSGELDRMSRPSTYGRGLAAAAHPARSGPLVLSKTL
jgi:hypothetical protein